MTNRFIQHILSITKDKLSATVYEQARKCLIDYLAVTIPGARMLSEKTEAYLQNRGNSHEQATVIGLNCKTDMQTAALINGMNAHVIELDDGHRQGALHIGSTVFSALLAVAEKENLTSEDSKKLVDDHLCGCDDCTKELAVIMKAPKVPVEVDV